MNKLRKPERVAVIYKNMFCIGLIASIYILHEHNRDVTFLNNDKNYITIFHRVMVVYAKFIC
jgi:hypothetical protein